MAETRGCIGQITKKVPIEAWKHSMKRGRRDVVRHMPRYFIGE